MSAATSSGGSSGSGSAGSNPVGYYTDLSSAPTGASVTAYGAGFGASGAVTLGGTAQMVISYSDTKVVFTVAGSGGALVVGGRSVGNLPVHTGRVLQATPSTLQSVWASTQPGDVVYLRAGTYNQVAGDGTWCMDCTLDTFKNGTASQPIALVGYPGETAVMTNTPGTIYHSPIALADQNSSGQKANYLTFADFNITGNQTCIDGGGDTTQPSGGPDKTGGANIRVVAIRCEITDTSNNTMTGMISVQNDGWKLLGNTFVNSPNRVIINNNHGIYIQDAASNIEVAYNQLVNLRLGHVIQIHQDGTPKVYQNVWVHDNLLQAANNGDMRGMNVGNVASTSTVTFENNVLRNLGQDFSGIAVYAGVVTIKNNGFYGVLAPDIDLNGQNGGTRKVTATGNRFETVGGYSAVMAENGASLTEITLSGNQYCGQPALAGDLTAAICTP